MTAASPPPPTGAPPGAAGHPLRWPILVVLCLSLLIVGLDVTVLNVALPTLINELGAYTGELQWLVDIYSLMAAGLMLFAGSTTELMIARGVMGVGEALIMPATLSIIGVVFTDPKERMKAIGLWSAMIGVGLAMGPLVGGWLLGQFWWGSVFLINVPIGVLALAAALKMVPNSKAAVARRLDLPGALLSVLGVGTLLWAIIEGPSKGWTSAPVLIAFAVAVLLLIAFVTREHTAKEPMLPLGIFAHRRLAVGNILVFLGLLSLLGALFVIVQYLQFVLGYDAGGDRAAHRTHRPDHPARRPAGVRARPEGGNPLAGGDRPRVRRGLAADPRHHRRRRRLRPGAGRDALPRLRGRVHHRPDQRRHRRLALRGRPRRRLSHQQRGRAAGRGSRGGGPRQPAGRHLPR
ncbi:MFS transporter [Streptomyces griseus]|uniref:MFS transporter n=1 Tax=Streptomyces griseus TaxID=1911 RepID=UPI0038036B91